MAFLAIDATGSIDSQQTTLRKLVKPLLRRHRAVEAEKVRQRLGESRLTPATGAVE